MPAASLDQLVSLCKRRGFVFPGSEIYGGLANTWDYGPLGVELKNRVKNHWWKTFVHRRADMVGLDSSILMNRKVWEASGHISSFADAEVECKHCHQRFRGDKLLEEKLGTEPAAVLKLDQIQPMLMTEKICCLNCGKLQWTDARKFNLMFKTHQGVVEEEAALVYMRPETAQGIFVNFRNILDTMRMRLPFGVAQIGKAFRNEITPGNFTFRTREFEQMEIEYFIEPGTSEKFFDEWNEAVWKWYTDLGIGKDRLRVREHDKDELSHYSSRTIDIEYKFPWGWGELFGLANRGDFDFSQHQKFSGQDLAYTDPDDPKKKFLPHVIEPSFGCDRSILTFMLEAYTEEKVKDETRVVMKLSPEIAPVDIAILPLSKKEHLVAKAQELYKKIIHETGLVCDFDVTGSIGKRYRRQDEIGTPRCITVDFGTLGEDIAQGERDTVTIRDRDTLGQERVHIHQLTTHVHRR
ncbi:glycine--tRNA ligase [Candidatus Peregrinibacteria bacterium]|nr:glycine--tRNA ligase [Candidatus Peregrinibacteria bacterium]